ncbi:hypothetical protein TSMEX_002281 [Taenia solium]|eukprot:TsM_000777500 transcript=TsM_000777500 gene=TsM_000777500
MELQNKQCGGIKSKGGATTSRPPLLASNRQLKRTIRSRLPCYDERSGIPKWHGLRRLNDFTVLDSNEGSHKPTTNISPPRLISTHMYHRINKLNCSTFPANKPLSRSSGNSWCFKIPLVKSQPHPTKKLKNTRPKLGEKSRHNRVIPTIECPDPNETYQSLRKAHPTPKGTRLFLYAPNGPCDSLRDSSIIDVNDEMSASILLQCIDSNPRDTLQPYRGEIYSYTKQLNLPTHVDDVKNQQTDGRATKRSGVSVAIKSHAPDNRSQRKQSDQNTIKEEDFTLKTLSMLDDTVFMDDTPDNESSMTINLEVLTEEVDKDNGFSGTRLELLKRPSIVPSDRKPSMELKRNSQINVAIVANKTTRRTSEFVEQMSTSLSYAQSYHQGIIPEVGPLTLNMSNSNTERPTLTRKNSHKTIWQRLFRRHSKNASKDSEELSRVNSKSRTLRSTSPSLEVVTQKTLNSFKTQSNNTWNVRQNAFYDPPEPFEIAKTRVPQLKEEIVHMASKGNQTDFMTTKGKSSKKKKTHAPPETPRLVAWQSSSKEGALPSVNPREGNRQNSMELTTMSPEKLKGNSSKVISVEVSNSSIASADTDLVCFVQVAKSVSIENGPPKSYKMAHEEKGTCNTQKTILSTSQLEGEGVIEGCPKRAECRRANLEIKAPCVSTITNCVDTIDEDDPFASDHFSSVFSARDSLDLCTWVEKPTHFKISEDKPISRKTEPSTAAGSIAPLLLEEERCPKILHPKDSLDMYVLEDVDPAKKKPFKNEVKFLLKKKKTELIQKENRMTAVDDPRVLPQPQQKLLQKVDFVDALEELVTQFQHLKRQNSNIIENRTVVEGNKLGEEEDDNITEFNFCTENDDSIFSDQNRPASEPPPALASDLHGQQDVVNEELTSFPKVRVFITSPDSLTHTSVEELSHNSPSIDQASPTDASSQFVIISPYSSDSSNHPSVVGPVPTIPISGANLGAFYCVLPNQSEKQHQAFDSSSNLALHPFQCGSVMYPPGVGIPMPSLLTESHLHCSELPQQGFLLNPVEVSPCSPVCDINELPSIQSQSLPACNLLNPGTQFECPNCRPVHDSNYAASLEGSAKYVLPVNHENFQKGSANSAPKFVGCIKSEMMTNNQKHSEISNRTMESIEVVPFLCTLNTSSKVISPNSSALITEHRFVGDKQDKIPSSEAMVSGENAPKLDILDKAKGTHPIHIHACSLENNGPSDNAEKRTNYLESNVVTTGCALKTSMSTATGAVDTHFLPGADFISGAQVRTPCEYSRQASSPSEKGSCTEIEVIGIDDEANTGDPEHCEVDQSAVLIEKISDSLVSFLKLHSTTRHSRCDANTKKEAPGREVFSFVPNIPQNMRCNRQADYEVSISVGGNSQADLKVRLGSMNLTREGQKEDHSAATPLQKQSTRCGNTGEVEQPRSADEDTLRVPSSKSIADSDIQSETLKLNASTISGGEFDEPVVGSSAPKVSHEQDNQLDKNFDGKEDGPAPETEALEVPLNVATNKNSCDIFNQNGFLLSTDSKQRGLGENADVSEFQNVMVTLKDPPSAAPSSTFKALNVEVKANPAWLCQGMFVRAVKIRKESGYTEGRSGAGENGSVSPASFIYHEEIRNQSIPTIKINHSDHVDSEKSKDGRFILDCSMDVLQPSKIRLEESNVIDHLGFISVEGQSGTIHRPITRILRRDSGFEQCEGDMPLRTSFRSTLQTTPDSSGNGAHTRNGQNNASKMEKFRRRSDIKPNEQVKVLEINEPIEDIRPKPRKLVNAPAFNTSDNSRKRKLSPTNEQEMPALIFVPGTHLPTELMKLYDSKIDHPSGWCIMPLPVYRTQHALYAAYAQNFPGFKV